MSSPGCGTNRPPPGHDPAGETSRPRPGDNPLGQRIKFLRASLGFTLKDLERRGGISATHLSEIERGITSPTVRALGRIAQALGVEASALVEWERRPEASVGRSAERRTRVVHRGRATIEPLTPVVGATSIGAYLLLLPPGAEPAFTSAHEGEEWLTVLSGTAVITVDGHEYRLRERDSLHFRCHAEHSYANPGTESALLLVACHPRLTI